MNQVVEATFAHYLGDKLIDENEVFFRWIHPAEFELLATHCGLRVEERFGDFAGAPFTGQENIVWILKQS